jgi:hypothetical protein
MAGKICVLGSRDREHKDDDCTPQVGGVLQQTPECKSRHWDVGCWSCLSHSSNNVSFSDDCIICQLVCRGTRGTEL